MALMEKIQTVGNAVNEMKNKLGLPVSSPLQEVVDKCGTGGEAYDGILPVQPTGVITQYNKNTLHISLSGLDEYADGVRVYYKEGGIPEHGEATPYVDVMLPDTDMYLELEDNKVYGFRYNSFVITEQGTKVFQTARTGNECQKNTVFFNNTMVEINMPEEIIGTSNYRFTYSKKFQRLFLISVSNYKVYELADNSWVEFGEVAQIPQRWIGTKYGLFASQTVNNKNSLGDRCLIDLINNTVRNYADGVAAGNVFVAGDGEVIYITKSTTKYTNPGFIYNGITNEMENLATVHGIELSQSSHINALACNGRVYVFSPTDAFYYEDGVWHTIVKGGSSITSMTSDDELFREGFTSCIKLPDNKILVRTSHDSKLYLVTDTSITDLGITCSNMYLSKNNTLFYVRSGGLYYLDNDYTTEVNIITDSSLTSATLFNDSKSDDTNNFYVEDDFGFLTIGYSTYGKKIKTIDTNTKQVVAEDSDNRSIHLALCAGYAIIVKHNSKTRGYFDPESLSYVTIGSVSTSANAYSNRFFVAYEDFIFFGGTSTNYSYNEGLWVLYKNERLTKLLSSDFHIGGVCDLGDGKILLLNNNSSTNYRQIIYDAETNTYAIPEGGKVASYRGGSYGGIRFTIKRQGLDWTNNKLVNLDGSEELQLFEPINSINYTTFIETEYIWAGVENTEYKDIIILKGQGKIDLVGSSYQEIYAGEEYIERGCDASNVLPNGVDYTDQVVIDTSELDIYKIGAQKVYYRLNIDGEEIIGTRKVNVKDPYKWEISPPIVKTIVGYDFTFPEYKLYQISGDELIDITASVTYTHNVDITTEGDYEIIFTSNALYGIVSEYKVPVKVISSEILMADYSGEPTQYAGEIVSSVSTSGTLTTTEEKYTSSPKSLKLNGSSYIQYNFGYLQQFTIELFFYKADSASYPRLLYLGGINREIEVKGSSNTMYIGGDVSAGWVQDAWNKLTITRDSNNLITYYCNDKKLKTETNSDELTYLRLGRGSDSGNYFNGYIDDLVVINDQPFKDYKYWFAHKWVGNSSSSGNNSYYVGYSNTLPVGTNYSITPIDVYLKFSTLEKMETFLDTYDASLAETITTTNNKMSLNTSPSYTYYSNFDIYNNDTLYFAKNVEDTE
ncbi:MAG: hypothetical protein IJ272_02155 [Clostridia bacterium]|nr:hypothetical protein [Clostridia bacterium]